MKNQIFKPNKKQIRSIIHIKIDLDYTFVINICYLQNCSHISFLKNPQFSDMTFVTQTDHGTKISFKALNINNFKILSPSYL